MNTLHLYHWHNKAVVKNNLKMVGQHDSLVIYGKPSKNDLNWLTGIMQDFKQQWFFVATKEYEPLRCLNKVKTINHQQWLDLILKHHNTLTWK